MRELLLAMDSFISTYTGKRDLLVRVSLGMEFDHDGIA